MTWHKRLANGKLIAMRMRGHKHRYGFARLISAVAAFALIFANVVGAYPHAIAHGPGAAHAGCDQHLATSVDAAKTATHASADEAASPIAHEHGDPDHRAGCSCGCVCHGGAAILPVPVLVAQVPEQPASPHVARSIDLLVTGSLERPPRPSVRA